MGRRVQEGGTCAGHRAVIVIALYTRLHSQPISLCDSHSNRNPQRTTVEMQAGKPLLSPPATPECGRQASKISVTPSLLGKPQIAVHCSHGPFYLSLHYTPAGSPSRNTCTHGMKLASVIPLLGSLHLPSQHCKAPKTNEVYMVHQFCFPSFSP